MIKRAYFFALFFTLLFSSGTVFAEDVQVTTQSSGTATPATIQSQPAQSLQSIIQGVSQSNGATPITTVQPSAPGTAGQTVIAPVAVPEVVSGAEEYITGDLPADVSNNIRQFGYDLFRKTPSSFAPVQNVPVGPDYVIGPGDEIRIVVWGRIEGAWSVSVDRDGRISLPKIGVIGVAGLTFQQLKDVLKVEMSKYYTGYEMSVSMGALRTIRVYIVGNAQSPGAYSVSSLSTLVTALFEAGGPGKAGSMRDIQLKRNGKTIMHFDMYDFLLKGDKSKDARLMPEDVIFIPSVGPLVGIAGNVKNPAIYELNRETGILELINMAGGLTSIAFTGRIQVRRIEDHKFRNIFERDIVEIEKNAEKDFKLRDGDLIKVFSVVETKDTIIIAGAVAKPGTYAVTPKVTKVSDVLSQAGGTLYFASFQSEITRVKVTQQGPVTERIVVDIQKAMAGDPQHNIPLEINDYIFVRNVPEWDLYKTVSIFGQVKYPGDYTITKGEKLSSLLERAGGFTDKAYLRGAVFTRTKVQESQQKNIDEMARRLETELLASAPAETAATLTPEDAKLKAVELQQMRDFINRLKAVKATGRVSIALNEPEQLKKTAYDIELEDGDNLRIPTNPSTVQVIGAVFNQTAFVFDKDKNFSNYIDLAGGYTDSADEDNEYILKVDGTAVKPDSGGLSWSNNSNRWEFGSQDVEPGDTVVVPEDLEKISWLREIKDVTQILYQIAVTAGVLIVAF
jgi:polysaccharide export outer membrane protein